MDSRSVLSSIDKIYDQLQVLKNLRLHMYRVASVGGMLTDSWDGPAIDKSTILATCLLHDVGNIVKFDIVPKRFHSYAGKGDDIKRWREVQEQMIGRYGADDHKATQSMLVELGVSERILYLVSVMGGIFSEANYNKVKSDNELAICSYSDLRVGPHGIISLEQRFRDLYERYSVSPRADIKSRGEKILANMEKGLGFERQLFEHERIKPNDINDKSIKPYLDKYIAGNFD